MSIHGKASVTPPQEEQRQQSAYLCQRCQKPINDGDRVYIHPGPDQDVRSHADCVCDRRQRERDEEERLYAEWRAAQGLETLEEHLPEAHNSST